MKDYIVTVMARDRVGIVRDVSTALSDLNGDITQMSQTVMRDYFTLIVSVSMPDDRTQLEIRQAVERKGDVGEFEVNVRPYEFTPPATLRATEKFVLSVQGENHPGIIARVTTYLAEQEINIDDFYAYIIDGRFVMLLHVAVPTDTDVENVQAGLGQLGQQFGITVHLQHENIFRATSEVSPIFDLQKA